MRDRVGAASATLLPNPTRRDSPPFGEFLCSQNFKERPTGWRVLCSGLCSSDFHTFSVSKFHHGRFAEPLFSSSETGSLHRGLSLSCVSHVPEPFHHCTEDSSVIASCKLIGGQPGSDQLVSSFADPREQNSTRQPSKLFPSAPRGLRCRLCYLHSLTFSVASSLRPVGR